jgi:hypothetical protein
MNAFLVENGFKVAPELSAMERLCQEVLLERFVFQVISDFLQPFLAIDQSFDYETQGGFEFLQGAGWVRHFSPLLQWGFWFVELVVLSLAGERLRPGRVR